MCAVDMHKCNMWQSRAILSQLLLLILLPCVHSVVPIYCAPVCVRVGFQRNSENLLNNLMHRVSNAIIKH